jgi:hypothetical protein
MNLERTISRTAAAVLAVAAFVALGCGGGNNSTTSSGSVAAFTPDVASPGPATIALLPSSTNGAAVILRVAVTGVPSFFGAAFRISYDPTALLYSGSTNSGSFLRTGVTDADVLFLTDSTSIPGEVVITATRIDPTVAPPVPVTTTAELMTVTFVARKAIAVAAPEGRLDFSDPKQVCDGTTAPPGCGAVTVTWLGGGVSAQ